MNDSPQPSSELGTDLSLLDDSELVKLIRNALEAEPAVEADWIDVIAIEGKVTLRGRVGSNAEVAAANVIVRDEVGVRHVSNELVVDELHRGQASENAIEAAIADEGSASVIGKPAPDRSATSEHLAPDTESEVTRDPQEAVGEAEPYIPPDRPSRLGSD